MSNSKIGYNPDCARFKPEEYKDSVSLTNQPSPEEIKDEVLSGNELRISGPNYFNNYELSWLDFNFRVLEQAQNESNPLLERARFVGIVCNNLDEFFQKRVGGLKRQVGAGVNKPSIDGLTPEKQLHKIRKKVLQMVDVCHDCLHYDIVPALKEEGISFKSYNELTSKQKKAADLYFDDQIYPILTPLVVDQAHPFPFISNQSRSIAIEIQQDGQDEPIFARVKVPANRPRWISVYGKKKKQVFINIDELIIARIEKLFPGAAILSANIFRVTRNADIQRNEEEADDLLDLIEEELRERRFAEIVRLEIDEDTPSHIKNFLIEKMKITKADVYESDAPIGLSDCMSLANIEGFKHLKYKTWIPALHPVLRSFPDEEPPDIFQIIKKGDFIVHHPYHSFESSVQRFVDEAATDPNVLAIKQTLYRTSNNSPIMHSLIKAAETGKQVAVLVEIKARFDEQQNIDWAARLEKAGVHVSYGIPGLKIHSKITLVVRQEGVNTVSYAHIGTGNYHPGTANLYEDLGLFTTDEDLCADVSDLFNFLTGFAPSQSYRKLFVAPYYMRKQFTELVDYEIEQAISGKPSRIIAKMNSLEDPLLIQKLYEASRHGVEIDIICRGVCRLKPGVEGLSENIRIHSIIGRFLEHSRLFYFMHGGQDLYFFGSADIMHRNLDARVEAITPIEHPRLKKYLQFILFVSLRDNIQRWIKNSDNSYSKVIKEKDDYNVATQKILMHHAAMYREPTASVAPPAKSV